MSKEIGEYQRKLQMLELDNGDLRKKYAKIKKEKIEEAQEKLKLITSASSEALKSNTKRQKLYNDNELTTEILSFDLGTQPVLSDNSVQVKTKVIEERAAMLRPKGSLLGGPKMKLNN